MSIVYPDVKFAYLNGHFSYSRKSVITTKDSSLIRDINFIVSNNAIINDHWPNQIKVLTPSFLKQVLTMKRFQLINIYLNYPWFL